MFGDNQKQNVENGAVAVQAGNDVHITQNGLSYSEVRDVALDVFRANFFQLAGPAMETAKARAEEITEDFLKKLQQENPSGFAKGQDPDFQHALFTVQREYARNGDKDLGDLLVDLLVDRSKQEQRDILQIVLNESINTAPKLTEQQLSVLAIVFLLKYTQHHQLGNHEKLGDYFDKNIIPFASKLVKNEACYQHLEFTGCGSTQMGGHLLESIFHLTYPGLFQKGFAPEKLDADQISINQRGFFFTSCFNDKSKLQVRVNNLEVLEQQFEAQNVATEEQKKILTLFQDNIMNPDEVRERCILIRPQMKFVFDCWNDSRMQSFTLTSVGMAIGHANIQRLVGNFANLSDWIN